jgi:phosphoenolpyruvate carboxykinase (GTP)
VAPSTNKKSTPNARLSTKSGSIFTNVCHNLDNNTVWWEGLDKNPPTNAIDWKGNPWNGAESTEKGAHPNSRFTAPAVNCPCLSSEFENPDGVPISAFVFGGRRAKLAPLVYQSRDWNNGVFVGSIMASETTAAAAGAVGVVRRDPMAMLPFCGYNMADYWQHWVDIGKTLDPEKAPKIFNVNWFRKDDDGNFLWPGFGDNLRVLNWIIDRCDGKVDARETAIGYVPYAKDIDLTGIEDEVPVENLERILKVNNDLWKNEIPGIEEFYARFGDRLPATMRTQLDQLIENLD